MHAKWNTGTFVGASCHTSPPYRLSSPLATVVQHLPTGQCSTSTGDVYISILLVLVASQGHARQPHLLLHR